ncbi:imidazole glycerol phosphate synthase subunit HisH [Candidatus Vidania fulgoroideorum]
MTVGIVNLGFGNIQSIISSINIISKTIRIKIINRNSVLNKINKIIFPGQGNFNMVKNNLKNIEILNKIRKEIKNNNKNYLGICLGSQIMCGYNNESKFNGLGIFDICVKKLIYSYKNYKIPLIGWLKNYLKKKIIFKGIKKFKFYHAHSFYTSKNKYSIGISFYINFFSSVLKKKNILAIQFHPEKSGIDGLKIIFNFLNK